MEQMTNAIRNVNREVQLQQWQQQIMDCRSSGLTVGAWCEKNSMSKKTYYYHLRRVRESMIEAGSAIVPVGSKALSCDKIEIFCEDIKVALPGDSDVQMLSTVLRVMKDA